MQYSSWPGLKAKHSLPVCAHEETVCRKNNRRTTRRPITFVKLERTLVKVCALSLRNDQGINVKLTAVWLAVEISTDGMDAVV